MLRLSCEILKKYLKKIFYIFYILKLLFIIIFLNTKRGWTCPVKLKSVAEVKDLKHSRKHSFIEFGSFIIFSFEKI